MNLARAMAVSLAVSAAAAPSVAHAAAQRCFYSNDFRTWRAADARTIYIRVGTNSYYRLDLSTECRMLLLPNVHLVNRIRGSNLICTAIDWDLNVVQGIGGISQPCIVKSMTALTPPEAAAIPKKFKP